MTGIKTTITLERTLYIDAPETASQDELQRLVEQQILLPHQACQKAAQALRKVNIQVPGIELTDWTLTKTDYQVI